jgi:phage baseplate assembly protein gpV
MFWLGRSIQGAAQSSGEPGDARAAVGAGSTIVHSKFGGQIFGFDIDQNGTEGVLTEDKLLANGNVLAAVETFDQASGKILKVVAETETQDNFLTLGIEGASVGLVEREHVQGLYVVDRIYEELNPLDSNKFTGTWTPPLASDDIILGVSRNQGSTTTAVLAFVNDGNDFSSFVFGSNVGANTFEPVVTLTNSVFEFGDGPLVAYDSVTNQAVVAASTGAVGGPPPVFALVDLTTGVVTEFNGLPGAPPLREGFVNGLAVDSEDGIACTTTEVDFKVEFYNLKTETGISVVLPGATSQLQSGSDVEFDPVHKLFFVAQSVSSTGPGSSIQVYNTKGKLVESLNGFSFSNASNVVFTHIALNPSNRSGYVDGPDSGVTEIQSFTY